LKFARKPSRTTKGKFAPSFGCGSLQENQVELQRASLRHLLDAGDLTFAPNVIRQEEAAAAAAAAAEEAQKAAEAREQEAIRRQQLLEAAERRRAEEEHRRKVALSTARVHTSFRLILVANRIKRF
jgi:hypothetical protein